MNKAMKIGVGIIAALFVIYNLIAFAAPFDMGLVFWISYGFTVVSFAVLIYSLYKTFVLKTDTKAKIYGFPYIKIAGFYWFLQMATGLFFCAMGRKLPFWMAVAVGIILLAMVIGIFASIDSIAKGAAEEDKEKEEL